MQNNKSNLQCLKCLRVFKSKLSLDYHDKAHQGIYKCPSCSKAFPRLGDVKSHLNKHILKNETKPGTQKFYSHRCDLCDSLKLYKGKNSLWKHLVDQHYDTELYKCHCGQVFNTTRSLADHKKLHDKEYCCDMCSRCFTRMNLLVSHRETKHLNIPREKVPKTIKKKRTNEAKPGLPVRREPGVLNIAYVLGDTVKKKRLPLGFTFVGKIKSSKGEIGMFIETILPSGQAEMEGRLQIGDEILEINGVSVSGQTESQVRTRIEEIKRGILALTVRAVIKE